MRNILSHRGVDLNAIEWHRLRWYLYFRKMGENITVNSPIPINFVVAKLQGLRIGNDHKNKDDVIVVESVIRLPRIEVADVLNVE